MKTVMVGLKRVVDYNIRVRVKPDGSGVAVDGLKMSINPFDEIALEEALRIKERGQTDEVLVVTVGSGDSQQQLRTGLAMGADRAILVATDLALEPLAVAKILHALVARERPGLVLLGKQSIDADNNQTGQMLAALWGRPQATFASKLVIDAGTATVTREVDTGLEVLAVELPAVVTTDLRLNQPRYVKLPDILKAKSKPLEVLPADALNVGHDSQFAIVHTEPAAPRAKGVIVRDAAELVAALRQRGVI
jgi:electron transfer flavoprotein beta subunit